MSYHARAVSLQKLHAGCAVSPQWKLTWFLVVNSIRCLAYRHIDHRAKEDVLNHQIASRAYTGPPPLHMIAGAVEARRSKQARRIKPASAPTSAWSRPRRALRVANPPNPSWPRRAGCKGAAASTSIALAAPRRESNPRRFLQESLRCNAWRRRLPLRQARMRSQRIMQ